MRNLAFMLAIIAMAASASSADAGLMRWSKGVAEAAGGRVSIGAGTVMVGPVSHPDGLYTLSFSTTVGEDRVACQRFTGEKNRSRLSKSGLAPGHTLIVELGRPMSEGKAGMPCVDVIRWRSRRLKNPISAGRSGIIVNQSHAILAYALSGKPRAVKFFFPTESARAPFRVVADRLPEISETLQEAGVPVSSGDSMGRGGVVSEEFLVRSAVRRLAVAVSSSQPSPRLTHAEQLISTLDGTLAWVESVMSKVKPSDGGPDHHGDLDGHASLGRSAVAEYNKLYAGTPLPTSCAISASDVLSLIE